MKVTVSPGMRAWGEKSFVLMDELSKFFHELPQLVLNRDIPHSSHSSRSLLTALQEDQSVGLVLNEWEYEEFQWRILNIVRRSDATVHVFIARMGSMHNEPFLEGLDHLELLPHEDIIRRSV